MADIVGVSVAAGLELTLLGTKLIAGLELKDSKQHIFLYKDLSDADGGITIGELIADLKTLAGGNVDLDETKITKALTPASDTTKTFKPESIRIALRTVYLDIVRNADGTGETKVDYAFQLEVRADELFPANFKLVKVERLTLAVWNTKNPKIIKQMALPELALPQ